MECPSPPPGLASFRTTAAQVHAGQAKDCGGDSAQEHPDRLVRGRTVKNLETSELKEFVAVLKLLRPLLQFDLCSTDLWFNLLVHPLSCIGRSNL